MTVSGAPLDIKLTLTRNRDDIHPSLLLSTTHDNTNTLLFALLLCMLMLMLITNPTVLLHTLTATNFFETERYE